MRQTHKKQSLIIKGLIIKGLMNQTFEHTFVTTRRHGTHIPADTHIAAATHTYLLLHVAGRGNARQQHRVYPPTLTVLATGLYPPEIVHRLSVKNNAGTINRCGYTGLGVE